MSACAGNRILTRHVTSNRLFRLQANGKRNGFGALKFSNGDVFEGIWVDDERSGFGLMKFGSGEEYKGGWLSNKFHGAL